MKKVINIVVSVGFVIFFSCCLFYCMVAGAESSSGALGYVIMAAILAVNISLLLCIGFHYIQKLKKQLKELKEKENMF